MIYRLVPSFRTKQCIPCVMNLGTFSLRKKRKALKVNLLVYGVGLSENYHLTIIGSSASGLRPFHLDFGILHFSREQTLVSCIFLGNSDKNVTKNEKCNIIGQFPSPFLLLGDFSAKHPFCDCKTTLLNRGQS